MAGCAEKQNLCTGRLRGLVNISQYNSHICYALIKLEENEAREATATSMLAIPHGFRPHHAFVVDLESGTVLVHVEGAKRVLMVRPENILPAPCTSAKCMPRGRGDADASRLHLPCKFTRCLHSVATSALAGDAQHASLAFLPHLTTGAAP